MRASEQEDYEGKRFIVDQMLIRLGRWLRLAGQDVENPSGSDDTDLIAISIEEDRVLLTRDRALAALCRRAGADCILIESSKIDDQLREMASSGIELRLEPKRCTICNGNLFEDELQSRSMERTVWRCERCGKLYWMGSHWIRMKNRLEDLSRS